MCKSEQFFFGNISYIRAACVEPVLRPLPSPRRGTSAPAHAFRDLSPRPWLTPLCRVLSTKYVLRPTPCTAPEPFLCHRPPYPRDCTCALMKLACEQELERLRLDTGHTQQQARLLFLPFCRACVGRCPHQAHQLRKSGQGRSGL